MQLQPLVMDAIEEYLRIVGISVADYIFKKIQQTAAQSAYIAGTVVGKLLDQLMISMICTANSGTLGTLPPFTHKELACIADVKFPTKFMTVPKLSTGEYPLPIKKNVVCTYSSSCSQYSLVLYCKMSTLADISRSDGVGLSPCSKVLFIVANKQTQQIPRKGRNVGVETADVEKNYYTTDVQNLWSSNPSGRASFVRQMKKLVSKKKLQCIVRIHHVFPTALPSCKCFLPGRAKPQSCHHHHPYLVYFDVNNSFKRVFLGVTTFEKRKFNLDGFGFELLEVIVDIDLQCLAASGFYPVQLVQKIIDSETWLPGKEGLLCARLLLFLTCTLVPARKTRSAWEVVPLSPIRTFTTKDGKALLASTKVSCIVICLHLFTQPKGDERDGTGPRYQGR
jgi:hypothetical protein